MIRIKNSRLACLLLALVSAVLPWSVLADAGDAIVKPGVRERYTKYEYRIPMRDGIRLFTVVYVPKDAAKTYPFLMIRTPYGSGVHDSGQARYGVDFYPNALGPSKEMEDSGYIFVSQDVRGRYMSEGVWQEMTPHLKALRQPGEGTESADMHDTVEWLLKNIPGNNGKVGIWGVSYPGFYTSASIIDSHPAIKAASPQAPVTDLYMGDDSYHGGAFMLAANFDFYSNFTVEKNPTVLPKAWHPFDYGMQDGYAYFLKYQNLPQITAQLNEKQRELLLPTIAHNTYDDFWKSRNIAAHLTNIHAAVLTVGGWYDAEDLQGPLTTYQTIKNSQKEHYNGLVMGPWSHGGWGMADGKNLGHVSFDSKTGEYYRKHILFPFFEYYLKGNGSKPGAEATMFETGTNVWRSYPSWPPQQAKKQTLYFSANGSLNWNEPREEFNTFDSYISDPKKPVPFIPYTATGVPREYMVSDQRFAATRPDVLTYQTEPLEEDVTVAGPVEPALFVSTSGTDADWIVKLIDVYPAEYPEKNTGKDRMNDVPPPAMTMAGYQQLVRGEPLRGKFRNSFEKPEPFVPGKVAAIRYRMPDILHTFRRGHRIMVQVQSSWFPLIDLNPQKFSDLATAKTEDFQAATQRIYRSPGQYSGIVLPVLPR
ncbi:CocE/NonD family hydrolase [Undibacterium oligocarboniphilum]|uniref:CocE/NonD family hydrolase n=1 Tax=Undibacterium oligocarboniphilum TaxID=666702 RepID=A0A850QB40_9BURK|nr:CocE/NonD family hydrolase [Undibacterium oligocarboniphilum]MBC3868820.1 CocE/NonD family hydrolase [Undibacterium oligocarboniphilum]NVO76801.1 CocE/NonD family hydrolase [Undibacterium oligocarboniphilum]